MKTAEQFVNEECAIYNAEALVEAVKARDIAIKAATFREAARHFEPHFWARRDLERMATALDGIASDGFPVGGATAGEAKPACICPFPRLYCPMSCSNHACPACEGEKRRAAIAELKARP